jgi:hypothetical protein
VRSITTDGMTRALRYCLSQNGEGRACIGVTQLSTEEGARPLVPDEGNASIARVRAAIRSQLFAGRQGSRYRNLDYGLPMRGISHAMILCWRSPLHRNSCFSVAFRAKAAACSPAARFSRGSDIHSRMIALRALFSGLIKVGTSLVFQSRHSVRKRGDYEQAGADQERESNTG